MSALGDKKRVARYCSSTLTTLAQLHKLAVWPSTNLSALVARSDAEPHKGWARRVKEALDAVKKEAKGMAYVKDDDSDYDDEGDWLEVESEEEKEEDEGKEEEEEEEEEEEDEESVEVRSCSKSTS